MRPWLPGHSVDSHPCGAAHARVWGSLWLVAALTASGCGGSVPAACEADSDCAANLCLGEAVCNQGRCVRTGSAVTCATTDDTACSAAVCDPGTGQCAQAPRRAGQPCEDGEPCTWGDRCAAGACVAGPTNVCACATTSDCADDGDPCSGVAFCDTSRFPYQCRVNPATVVTCPEGSACVSTACDAKTGKCADSARPDGTPCDDGDPCSANDTCGEGSCAAGEPVCGCTLDSDCKDADGDPCTGVPYCDSSGSGGGVCKPNPASAVTCSNKLDTACRKNQCDPATGACALTAAGDKAPCDDGDACTAGETCAQGVCAGGTDTCGCTDDKDCAAQDDGDLCNGTLFCQLSSGTCALNPATVVTCATVGDTACAKNVCVPTKGTCAVLPRAAVEVLGCVTAAGETLCAWTPANATGAGPFACEDGDACTVGDTCVGTSCKAGKQACACESDPDCLKEDDGDLCNGVPYCDKAVGACKPNPSSAVYCSPAQDTDCLKAVCNPNTGGCALKAKVKAACDDGDPCTTKDVCTPKGSCAGQANLCDDGDPCTADSCKGGCVHVAKTCDDGNSCTVIACDPSSGKCTVGKPSVAGTVCNADSDGCTVGDVCDGAGGCVAGPQRLCTGSTNPCLPLSCVSSGAQSSACVAKSVADGTSCADGDACVVGDTCVKGKCTAGTQPTLWVKATPVSDAAGGGVAIRANGDVVTAARRLVSGADVWEVRWLTRTGAARYPPLTLKAPASSSLGYAMAVVDLGPVGVAVVGRVAKGGQKGSAYRIIGGDGKPGDWVEINSSGSARVTAAKMHPSGNLVLGETTYSGSKPTGYRLRMLAPSGAEIWSTTVPGSLPHEVDDLTFTAAGGVVFSATSKQWNSSAKTFFPFTTGHLSANGSLRWAKSLQAPHDPVRSAVLVFDNHEFVFFSRDNTRSPRWNPFQLETDAPSGNRRHIGGTFHPTRSRVVDGRALSIGHVGGAAALALHDRYGNEQWVRVLKLPSKTVLEDFDVDLARRRVVVLGVQPKAKPIAGLRPVEVGSPVVASLTLWGGDTCGQDACVAKTYDDCDDQSPCTSDRCAPASGCQHSVVGKQVCAPATGCAPYGSCSNMTCSEPLYGSLRVQSAVTSTKARGLMTSVQGVNTGWWGVGDHLYGQELLPDGSLSFQRAVECPGFEAPIQIVTRADGLIFALGKWSQGGGAVCMFRHDTTVAPKVVSVRACKNCKVFPLVMALASDGRIAVATSAKVKGFGGSFVTFFDYHVQQTSSLPTFASGPVTVSGLTFDTFGTAVAVGSAKNYSGAASSERPWAMFRSGSGAVKKQLDFKAVKRARLFAVAPQANGEFVGVGERTIGSSGVAPFVLGISANAKASWSVIPSQATGERFVSVVQAQGGYIVAGDVTVGGVTKVFLSRRLRGNNGAVLWTRTHAFNGSGGLSATPNSLLAAPGRTLLLGAQAGSSSATPLFIRANGFGFMSCSEAGACASPSKTCDDHNACTADWCDPTTGCKWTKLSGGPCGQGGTCSAGTCVGG